MNETCKKLNVTLHLTHVKASIIVLIRRLNENKFDETFIYPTNHDAVLTICNQIYGDLTHVTKDTNKREAVVMHRQLSTLDKIIVNSGTNGDVKDTSI